MAELPQFITQFSDARPIHDSGAEHLQPEVFQPTYPRLVAHAGRLDAQQQVIDRCIQLLLVVTL
jgi:hypothetical protein